MTLNDLAQYSMTWSIVRSICDSWASCLCWHSSGNPVLCQFVTWMFRYL